MWVCARGLATSPQVNWKCTNCPWHSARCQPDTCLLSLEDLLHPHLQVCPYLWLFIQLSDWATYLFCDRNKQHLGPGIWLEFEGCVLSLELETGKIHGFERARCIGFFTGCAKAWIDFILMARWERVDT